MPITGYTIMGYAMVSRRWLSLGCVALGLSLAGSRAWAQLAPTGGHYGGRPSDTGFHGGVSSSGGYQAAVPLELPGARGGLPVPVQVVYTERAVGAAGLGWDVPLSFVRVDTTLARRRPKGNPGAAPQAPERVSVHLEGRRIDLVRTATAWVARHSPDLEVRQQADGSWRLLDGQGRTYQFTSPAPALAGTGLWLLTDVTGVGGSKVHLDYAIATPAIPGGTAISVDLTAVSYNPSPTVAGCFKDNVELTYDAPAAAALARWMLGGKVFERRRKLIAIGVSSKPGCGGSGELVRRYQLAYQADVDTGQPRLQSVQLTGRAGTPEAGTPITIAAYSYGAATRSGSFTYVAAGQSALGFTELASTASTPPMVGVDPGWTSTKSLVDVTGDGRPDVIAMSGAALKLTRNKSGPDAAAFEAPRDLADGVLTSRAIEARSLKQVRYSSVNPGTNDLVWRQTIDFNGDGRLDLVDAAEQAGRWVIYLNTPDPTKPGDVRWVRRSISTAYLAQQLNSRGLAVDPAHVPLSRRATYRDWFTTQCWIYQSGWTLTNKPWLCGPPPASAVETTITEWEVLDVNGDSYPDVVFDSAPVVNTVQTSAPPDYEGYEGELYATVTVHTQALPVGRLDAVLNVVGTRLTSGDEQPFSAPITVLDQATCGVEQWWSSQQTSFAVQRLLCGLPDVNGDGLVDRVDGLSVYLGTGSPTASGLFTPGAMFTLPDHLAIQRNHEQEGCKQATTFSATMDAGLRDLNGDGIPDYVTGVAGSWYVHAGTGVGFAQPRSISGQFALSQSTETCVGSEATTTGGLFDLDGDGKPDVVKNSAFYQLQGASGQPGAPDAGRLIRIDNGYGAQTHIHYRSIKADPGVHQVPFPEIVVDSVDTTVTKGLGAGLLATRYAYSGAELSFDPATESFSFPGYRRKLELPTPVGQPAGVATLSISDAYAPVSAVDPYGLTTGANLDAAQRYARLLRAGRVSDQTVLTGDFGAAALTNPSLLLAIDVDSDPRRIARTHHEWSARLLTAASDPPGPEPCPEMVYPYDYAGSLAFAAGHPTSDGCATRGFGFQASVQTWRGQPGAAPPSSDNVETRSEITAIDDLGRVLGARQFNDLHRDDDDLCITTAYAAPTGSNERVLTAVSSQAVSDCVTTARYAGESWEYDGLPQGSVSAGLITAHLVERRDQSGGSLGTIRQFDATYDAAGNPLTVTTTRDDGATRTVSAAYDPFGLATTGITVTASDAPSDPGTSSLRVAGGVTLPPPTLPPTLVTSITRDPVTLLVTSTTEPTGTQHGATYDGFERRLLETVTPPGGAKGVLSVVSYLGFTGDDPAGRRIVSKVFTDPVPPGSEAAAAGRTSTVLVDELGRPRRTELALGTDYQSALLVVGARVYDGLGRVFVASDAYAVTPGQAVPPAYATTYYFNSDGTPSCQVRGTGQQPYTEATNEASEIFPTCYGHRFANHTEQVDVRDAASRVTGSPQAGVVHTSYATAIGRPIGRSTWQGATRLDHVTLDHDRLGHQISMTRYQDAAAGTKPVTSAWRYDSLGQVLQLDEPDTATLRYDYDRWGELTRMHRQVTAAGGATELQAVHSAYDSLGRLIHREHRINDLVDPATVNDYLYDDPVNIAPQVTPTYVLGRLAQASSPTGTESFSYDAFGALNARVFTDARGGMYIEKHETHADGSPKSLDLYLPDTAYAQEHVAYTYDSAGRGLTVQYTAGAETINLYTASTIDPFGRVRQAQYGAATYAATYADVGRQLLAQVSVTSPLGSRALSFPSYDPVGRERSRSEVRSGVAGTTTTASAYDAVGQLTHAVRTLGTTTQFDQRFTYDPLGNVLGIADTPAGGAASTTTLGYLDTDRDRLCHIAYGGTPGTTCNVSHDGVGNIVSQKTATGTRQYGYYLDGAVRTISDDKGSAAQFRYDAFGEVQELDLTSTTSLDTRRDRRYGGLLSWRDVTTGMSKTSVLTRAIPGPDGLVASRRGAGGPWVFTFGEARGARFATDQTGAFVQDVDYQPFGTPTSTGAQPGSLLYSSEQWNGGDALAAFGITKLGARLYDPAIGRFLSRDPLLIPRAAHATNPYAFAMNDPVNLTDPSGMKVAECSEPMLCLEIGGGGLSNSEAGGTNGEFGLDTRDPVVLTIWDLPGNTPTPGSPSGQGGSGAGSGGPPRSVAQTLQSRTLLTAGAQANSRSGLVTRIFGAVAVAGGALAATGGTALCTTGFGCVIGGLGVAYGADVAAAGATQLFTGEPTPTQTNRAIAALTSQQVADNLEIALAITTAGTALARTPYFARLIRSAGAPAVAAGGATRAIGFADDAVASAYQGMRSGGGHAMRHLIDEGLILNAGSLASRAQAFEGLTSPILRSPAASFDWRLGGTAARAFAGEAGGRQVVVFVAKEGPYQGRVLSAIVPDASQIAQWGL
jgi:RHS repeat-associated protein